MTEAEVSCALQGGGYAIRNVSRCWAYETSVLLDMPIDNNIPRNDYYDYYGPEYKLHLTVGLTPRLPCLAHIVWQPS